MDPHLVDRTDGDPEEGSVKADWVRYAFDELPADRVGPVEAHLRNDVQAVAEVRAMRHLTDLARRDAEAPGDALIHTTQASIALSLRRRRTHRRIMGVAAFVSAAGLVVIIMARSFHSTMPEVKTSVDSPASASQSAAMCLSEDERREIRRIVIRMQQESDWQDLPDDQIAGLRRDIRSLRSGVQGATDVSKEYERLRRRIEETLQEEDGLLSPAAPVPGSSQYYLAVKENRHA